MDKIYDLLLSIYNHESITQRKLAEIANLSLGTTNTLLNYLNEHQYITIEKENRKYIYHLTESGEDKLKSFMNDLKETKLQGKKKQNPLEVAVILAAGKAQDFSVPTALLPINEGQTTTIKRTIDLLTQKGIKKIYVVTGFGKEEMKQEIQHPAVTWVVNEDYALTGTMSSLSKVFPQLTEDFILIDGDLVYEERILDEIITTPFANAISCVRLSGSGDEAFVDMDEQNRLVRISKDIRQMNRLSAEMMGISKISSELLKEMKKLYQKNNNQWLNYEYLILQGAQTYEVMCTVSDNVAWGDLDDKSAYRQIEEYIFPMIIRHEEESQLQYAKEQFIQLMNFKEEDILSFAFAGGMTNTNYQGKTRDKDYFIRIPGKCTEVMINRENEALNAQIGSALGINVDTLYMNPQTGIKITEAVPKAETLSKRTARLSNTMEEIAGILRKLHQSDITFPNTFSFAEEWQKYEGLVDELEASYYEGYDKVKEQVQILTKLLEDKYGLVSLPCHNDLVAENFVRSGKTNKLYLLDWEYSGMNDPAWDLAAFTVENEITGEDFEYFLQAYYQKPATKEQIQKVKIFQVYQDVLWSAWTIAKEAAGQDFGSYGLDRFLRAKKQIEEILTDERD